MKGNEFVTFLCPKCQMDFRKGEYVVSSIEPSYLHKLDDKLVILTHHVECYPSPDRHDEN